MKCFIYIKSNIWLKPDQRHILHNLSVHICVLLPLLLTCVQYISTIFRKQFDDTMVWGPFLWCIIFLSFWPLSIIIRIASDFNVVWRWMEKKWRSFPLPHMCCLLSSKMTPSAQKATVQQTVAFWATLGPDWFPVVFLHFKLPIAADSLSLATNAAKRLSPPQLILRPDRASATKRKTKS